MAGKAANRAGRVLGHLEGKSLPFLWIGGRLRLQPPLLTVCQIQGELYAPGKRTSLTQGKGLVATRLLKQDTLSVEYMKELHSVDSQLEADLLAAFFGLKMAQKNGEEGVGIETISLPLMKTLLFGYQGGFGFGSSVHHCRARVLETAAEMEWVGVRWIPQTANEAANTPPRLQKKRGDGEEMR
jgi:hypothetical protein